MTTDPKPLTREELLRLPPCKPCDVCGGTTGDTWIRGVGCSLCRSKEVLDAASVAFTAGHETGEQDTRTSVAAWMRRKDSPAVAAAVERGDDKR